MSAVCSIGLDYGTKSVRCLIVDVSNGREVGAAVWEYAHGIQGVRLSRDPNLARRQLAASVRA
jgi:L-ribulokinase